MAEIVQLRYYTGLSVEETASVVGVSVSTLKRDWRYARAWLARRLGEGAPGWAMRTGIPQSIGKPMTEQHRLRVRAVFAQAADLPRDERGAFLDAACRGEPDLRAEVEGLLAYDSGFGTETDEDAFLKSPLVRTPERNAARVLRLQPLERRAWPAAFTSAAIASSAGTAKVAWAPSTRPNRTTRAAPSPSR